ncbi:MAG: biotin-independent malonate decarboxylase subunit gamma [Lachnospiraceae bacterium]|nr:biotin-independent malonate decarboxylase subunit gamma [Lachnospiraceae bacterium]
MTESLVGRGREAIDMIVDGGSFAENQVGEQSFDADFGPGAVVGTAALNGQCITVLANDAEAINPRFPVVYFGVIGMEEAYKMAQAVYASIEADREKPLREKRPLLLLVDTPGNGPGKVEEIFGMNKATGAYQLALAEARKAGHPILAVVIGRAISGAFLCHGLQADQILALPKEYGTMIHVMPITSISRITKLDVELLEELSQSNPVFAAGADFFYRLGGVEELIESPESMRTAVLAHIEEIYQKKESGHSEELGPWGRGRLGEARGGRTARAAALAKLQEEYEAVAENYL